MDYKITTLVLVFAFYIIFEYSKSKILAIHFSQLQSKVKNIRIELVKINSGFINNYYFLLFSFDIPNDSINTFALAKNRGFFKKTRKFDVVHEPNLRQDLNFVQSLKNSTNVQDNELKKYFASIPKESDAFLKLCNKSSEFVLLNSNGSITIRVNFGLRHILFKSILNSISKIS